MSEVMAYLASHRQRFLSDLVDLLAVPSISTVPEHRQDVRRAAELTGRYLAQAGLEHVEVIETEGHPVLVADWLKAPDRPTLLFYGHLDVQPADPESEWISAPFAPEIREGRLFARGAADTKANVLSGLWACEAYLASGEQLPVNVRFLLECEEEVGSPSLRQVVQDHRRRFEADAVINLDAGQLAEDQPSLTTSYRGLIGVELEVRTAEGDAHSGGLGGLIANAPMVLARLLAGLQDAEGRVLVPGFYDQVREIPAEVRRELQALGPQAERLAQAVGAKGLWGDPQHSPVARNWLRPTLEVNGIWGGFQGTGSKTVIPAVARAKLTCRLVADQEPGEVLALLEQAIKNLAPSYATVRVSETSGRAKPYHLAASHPVAEAAARVLSRLYGKPPVPVGAGGSVPATAIFHEELGLDSIAFGFALPDEHVHAPNEFFRLSDFDRGRVAVAMLMAEVGGEGSTRGAEDTQGG